MNVTEKYLEKLEKESYFIWDEGEDKKINLADAKEILQEFEVELLRDYDTIKRIQEMDETHY